VSTKWRCWRWPADLVPVCRRIGAFEGHERRVRSTKRGLRGGGAAVTVYWKGRVTA
jgi:hypothetical protein